MHVAAVMLLVSMIAMPFAQSSAMVFKKVDYYWINAEGDEKDKDARLVLDAARRVVGFYDEDKGEEKATYAVVPYDAITSITYEKSAHSRIAMGILLSPIAFFMKGKKHWLTIQFEGVDSLPAGYVYARLDKKTFQQVLAAIEAQLDIEIERIVEQ